MRKFLNFLLEFRMNRSKKPWAKFEIDKISDENEIAFKMHWNKAFIKKINSLGFYGSNEQETVENFLFSSLMYPKNLEEDAIVSDYHPELQNENILKT